MDDTKPAGVIASGRFVLNAHPDVRAAWRGFLHRLDQLDKADRDRLIRYIRLVYGTTGHVTLPIDGPPQIKDASTEEPRISDCPPGWHNASECGSVAPHA